MQLKEKPMTVNKFVDWLIEANKLSYEGGEFKLSYSHVDKIIDLYEKNKAWQKNMCEVCDAQLTSADHYAITQYDRIMVCNAHREYSTTRVLHELRKKLGTPEREPLTFPGTWHPKY